MVSGHDEQDGPAGRGSGFDGERGSGVPEPVAATPEEIAEEAIRYHRLQRAVQVSLALIQQSPDLALGESLEIVLAARSIALDLFPGSGGTFDLIYRPRFLRAISERFGIEDADAGSDPVPPRSV